MKQLKSLQTARIIGLLSLLLGLSACSSEKTDTKATSSIRPVKLITLETADNRLVNTYPGIVQAVTTRELSFQVSGLVTELPIEEAQEVEKGTILAKLDQRDFQSQYDAAKSQFANAEEEYQRAVRLAKENAIATSILEQRKSQRDVAQTVLDSAQKALSDTELTAPFSGVVAKVHATRLDNMQAGTPVLTLLGDQNGMKATANLPSSVVATINQRVDKDAVVMLDAAPGVRIPATFKEASLQADPSTQTFAVTFAFQPPEDLLVLPGMSATLVLSSSSAHTIENTVTVPIAAISSDGTQQFAWVVDMDTMRVSKRVIELQDGVGKSLLVTKDLEPGETIVGAGGSYLSEDMEVRPWSAK